MQCLLYTTTTMPVIRDIASGALSDYGYTPTPVGKLGASIARAGKGAYDQVVEGEDMSEAEFKAAFDAFGIWKKIPTGQIWSTGEYVRNFDDVEDPIREFLVGMDKD